MNLPYNNGKVSIGSAYCLNPLKPKYVEYDRDMLLLQKHLLHDPALVKYRYLVTRIVELCGIVVLLIILLKGYK